MTRPLFREDAYLREAVGRVLEVQDGSVVLDSSIFYPQGGGQPGDKGTLTWDGGEMAVSNTIKGEGGKIVLLSPEGPLPSVGTEVRQLLDWERRFSHMRVHTALHLLSVVIPLPVTGGQIGTEKGRLDFDMAEAPEDKDDIERRLVELIEADLPVFEDWISDEELRANPQLVKTMSVAPPTGAGRVRLIRIGDGEAQVDLQPCGGTHVARTGEIGPITLGKVENKGARNRRVNILVAPT
ncbi:alanyl-tRNA editing protein [Roseitranquillus sediminis]|uniref:alanyl-tRNA editing protein n=1 Tax=Roseitranquillus sediminis TaxID=2809051 RepID=UPI001D0C69DC|nr:alanyl-tRNA editing protein [Roseitranquillus sediminis]MBM9594407.1 alanyl-tRNA editing protein [Roseitranquillus sediminis]